MNTVWLLIGLVSGASAGVFLGRYLASSWDRTPRRQQP